MANTIETASELEALIEVWRERLSILGEPLVHSKPSEDRWSLSEVVGHLVDSACNNHQRFIRAQFCDEFEFPNYAQKDWVSAGNYRQCEWDSLILLWYHYNRQIALIIRSMPKARLLTSCKIGNNDVCTLGFLVTDYLDHLKHHLAKIAEIDDDKQR